LPALNLFGYPGLSDPGLSTETTLNVVNILDSHNKIRYKQGDNLFYQKLTMGSAQEILFIFYFNYLNFLENIRVDRFLLLWI
jgi:hypothetical protein